MIAASLCLAIVAMYGADIPRDRACAAAEAIVAEAGAWDPALLAAIGAGESKLTLGLVGSRGEVGAWQVRLYGPDRRRRERAALTSYADGVREAVRRLDESAAWCKRRGTPGELCTLTAYRGGPGLVRRGMYGGARKVLRRAAELRRAMEPARRVGS